jgi:hypothetical protein
MARLGVATLILALLPAPAWAQSSESFQPGLQHLTRPSQPDASRHDFVIGETNWRESDERISVWTKIGPNLTAGIGMFGYKRERAYQSPVTPRDLNLPKSRRVGMGISLKF